MAWIRSKQIHLIGIAFFFVFDFIFYYSRVVEAIGISLGLYAVICLVFASHIWLFNYFVVYLVRYFFPGTNQLILKRLVTFVIFIPIAVILTTIFQGLFFDLLNKGTDAWHFYLHFEDIGMNFLYTVIIISFLEMLYYFDHWSRAVTEAAELRTKNVEAQLQSLKNQVSPHFLFNSLNSLSTLIHAQPAEAVEFVNRLSIVYRYLLQSNEKALIKLGDESDFLLSYLHLLQTRFARGLRFQIDIDPTYKEYLIPPLTLQLLVENAVKHNMVSAQSPLTIVIYNQGDRIIIKNNLQKRRSAVLSTGIGLTNIVSKYRILIGEDISIKETETEFIVTLPLIKSDHYEGIDHRR